MENNLNVQVELFKWFLISFIEMFNFVEWRVADMVLMTLSKSPKLSFDCSSFLSLYLKSKPCNLHFYLENWLIQAPKAFRGRNEW